MPPSSAAAYQSLNNFRTKMVRPEDALSRGDQQYGVSGIRGQLDALRTLTGNLQTSIGQVDPSVTGRTQGGLVTEAQRSAIVNKERAPLMTQFADTTNKLGDAGRQFSEAQGLASNYAQSLLGSQDQEYSRLFGDYTTQLAQEGEAAKLAEQKRQFDAQMAESRASRAAAGGGGGLSLGGLGSGAAPAAAGPGGVNAVQAAMDYAMKQRDVANSGTQVPTFFRESVLKNLQRQFGNALTPQQLNEIIYKQVFPDNWRKAPAAAAKAPSKPGGGRGW